MTSWLSSLRSRLTLTLLLPLLAVLALSVVADYRTAIALANDTADRALLSTAMALTARLEGDEDDNPLELDLPPAAEAILRADGSDQLLYAVVDASGRRIAGDRALLAVARHPPPGTNDFKNVRVGGRAMRLVATTHATPRLRATVLVAETTRARDDAAQRILETVLWPNLLLVGTALAVVFFGVRLGLRPLDSLGHQIDQRPADDLSAIPENGIPSEARPLVAAINRLIGRVDAAARAQQAFLSDTAHQLRTPLAGIQTQLELALQDLPATAQPRLTRLLEATRRLDHFIRQMLALARSSPEAAAATEPHGVDLASLLEDCASDYLDAALAQGVELNFEPNPARVQGTPWLLRELLANLVDNAIAYSPAGGQVSVRCGQTLDGPWLEVEDEGPGIPAADRERVFERFYRAPGAQPEGSGLGLAIVRAVAQRHGARIRVGEGAQGRGARIRVEFPAG
jgi:two-component system sensor histidine kinase TctE